MGRSGVNGVQGEPTGGDLGRMFKRGGGLVVTARKWEAEAGGLGGRPSRGERASMGSRRVPSCGPGATSCDVAPAVSLFLSMSLSLSFFAALFPSRSSSEADMKSTHSCRCISSTLLTSVAQDQASVSRQTHTKAVDTVFSFITSIGRVVAPQQNTTTRV